MGADAPREPGIRSQREYQPGGCLPDEDHPLPEARDPSVRFPAGVRPDDEPAIGALEMSEPGLYESNFRR